MFSLYTYTPRKENTVSKECSLLANGEAFGKLGYASSLHTLLKILLFFGGGMMQLVARHAVCLTGDTHYTCVERHSPGPVRFPDIGSIPTTTTSVPKMVSKNGQEKLLFLRETETELFRGSRKCFHSHLKWFGGFSVKLGAGYFG